MTTDPLAQLDQRIALLRKRLEAAERMREAVKDDPELLQLLTVSDESPAARAYANGVIASPRKRPKQDGNRRIRGGEVSAGYFKRVADFLESEGNKPKSIPDMARAAGLEDNNVIQVVYRTHAVLFESHAVPGHATKKAWTLRKDWREILAKEEDKK